MVIEIRPDMFPASQMLISLLLKFIIWGIAWREQSFSQFYLIINKLIFNETNL